MSVSALTSAASASSAATVQNQASLVMMKKAMELQQANAAQLLEAVPPPAVGPTPGATVGGTIDIFA